MDTPEPKPQRRAYPWSALIYSTILPKLQRVAREHGYALAIHGSMATDFDLLACPWTDGASDAETLVESLRETISGNIPDESEWSANPAKKPHGRLAWTIYPSAELGEQRIGPYLDVSVMPRLPAQAEPGSAGPDPDTTTPEPATDMKATRP